MRVTCLPFPFESEVILDDDMGFAVRGMYVLGPCIRAGRRQRRRALQTVAKWLIPWDATLREHMPPTVAAVAANKTPGTYCSPHSSLEMARRGSRIEIHHRFLVAG